MMTSGLYSSCRCTRCCANSSNSACSPSVGSRRHRPSLLLRPVARWPGPSWSHLRCLMLLLLRGASGRRRWRRRRPLLLRPGPSWSHLHCRMLLLLRLLLLRGASSRRPMARPAAAAAAAGALPVAPALPADAVAAARGLRQAYRTQGMPALDTYCCGHGLLHPPWTAVFAYLHGQVISTSTTMAC